jgi:hypothetical protein
MQDYTNHSEAGSGLANGYHGKIPRLSTRANTVLATEVSTNGDVRKKSPDVRFPKPQLLTALGWPTSDIEGRPPSFVTLEDPLHPRAYTAVYNGVMGPRPRELDTKRPDGMPRLSGVKFHCRPEADQVRRFVD